MKVLISDKNGNSLIHLRGELIKDMVNRGHEVICTSPSPESEMNVFVEKTGIRYYCIKGPRTKIFFVNYISIFIKYYMIMKVWQPEVSFFCAPKTLSIGVFAAVLSKVKRIAVINSEQIPELYNRKVRMRLSMLIYRKYLRKVLMYCNTVFFMNQDDLNMFRYWNMVKKEQSVVLHGAGVNLNYYSKKPMPKTDVICMTVAFFHHKGIKEYMNAAKLVHEKYPKIRFLFVGDASKKPEAIEQEIDEAAEEEHIYYCGYVNDVRPYLEVCSIFVLPFYYEGSGCSIAEALAVGRPVITTTPKYREMVVNGYNGFLVSANDTRSLANKIMLLLENEKLKQKMAENSNSLCKAKFDVRNINKVCMDKMNLS